MADHRVESCSQAQQLCMQLRVATLRTARDHFSVMQLKPFVRPLRDAVSPLPTVGYGLACGSWDEGEPDYRLYLFLRSLATQYGGYAIL